LRTELETELRVEYRPRREGDVLHSAADISRARELLGYEPRVRWQDGIRPTHEYLKGLMVREP
jgi:nucleoside-diphosphate-sugar epimerase